MNGLPAPCVLTLRLPFTLQRLSDYLSDNGDDWKRNWKSRVKTSGSPGSARISCSRNACEGFPPIRASLQCPLSASRTRAAPTYRAPLEDTLSAGFANFDVRCQG